MHGTWSLESSGSGVERGIPGVRIRGVGGAPEGRDLAASGMDDGVCGYPFR